MSMLRKKILSKTQRVVVKVGSRILVELNEGRLNTRLIGRLVTSLLKMREAGMEVVLVSSGAVGAGMAMLGLDEKPRRIEKKQACAAVGQIKLMRVYDDAFRRRGHHAGQILLSAEDFRRRDRYQNIRNTVRALLSDGVVPIINENDSVATDEIQVGDNDKLSADVAQFLEADLLIILTDEDGLYDRNPKKNSDASLLSVVRRVTPDIEKLADSSRTSMSTGGMKSKLEAIRQATEAGSHVILANGFRTLPHALVAGKEVGTLFLASDKKMSSRNRWLSFVSTTKGHIVVDAGAKRALLEHGSSLLPVGVTEVHGRFLENDLVEVRGPRGEKIARGITSCSSAMLVGIMGRRSSDQHRRRGDKNRDKSPAETIHKDNLVLF